MTAEKILSDAGEATHFEKQSVHDVQPADGVEGGRRKSVAKNLVENPLKVCWSVLGHYTYGKTAA